MNNFQGLRVKKRISAFIVSSALLSFSINAYAAEIPASGNLTLQDAVRTAIKNAPTMITESIKVDLAKADEMEAGDPFGASFKASGAINNVRGYQYPTELQQIGMMAKPQISTFVTDNKDENELKTSLSKLFRNGVYADFSIALQSSDSDKLRADFANGNVVAGLNAAKLKPGAQTGDYFPSHPSIVQLTVNVPLLKFSGENNIAAANESQKRYQREAAEATLKQGVASIIRSVVNNYWEYKAALIKLQYTQDSEAQVKQWLGALDASVEADKRDKTLKTDTTSEIAHLRGFATQLGADVSKAQEAVNVARNALAQAIGISAEDAGKIVQAQDDYPLDWSAVLTSFDDNALRKKWNALAEKNRFDLQAAGLQLEAAKAIFLGAQNDEQSKLDLTVILKQQGLSGGGNGVELDSLSQGRSDLGNTVMLSFEKKLGNDKAKAQVTRTRYLKLQKEVEYNNAKRTVGLDVDSAVSSVRNSLVGLAAAKQQTAYYVTALDAIVGKKPPKLNEVFDLVVIEQARLKAVNDHVSAIQKVANAVTAAHFQTGTLLKQVDNIQEVAVSDLTMLP
ncbi:MAG: TolC family protein [Sulfuricellaceae bacterium]